MLKRCGPLAIDGQKRLVDETAVLETDDAVGDVEIAFVVADDQERLAGGSQFREQRVIEEPFEGDVLIGGRFIEDANRPIFQPGAEQGQAPLLALREVDGGERVPLDRDVGRQAQSFQSSSGPCRRRFPCRSR